MTDFQSVMNVIQMHFYSLLLAAFPLYILYYNNEKISVAKAITTDMIFRLGTVDSISIHLAEVFENTLIFITPILEPKYKVSPLTKDAFGLKRIS